MVVKVVPGHGHPVTGPHNIALTVVIVRAVVDVGLELVVVDPYAGAVLDRDAIVIENESDTKIANDHVGLVEHIDAFSGDFGTLAGTNETLVASDLETSGEIEFALGFDDPGYVVCEGRDQFRVGGDCDCLSSFATDGWSEGVVFAETDEAEINPCWGRCCEEGKGSQ